MTITAAKFAIACSIGYDLANELHSGFELALGLSYDFNFTRHWALGAYIEGLPMIREHGILGLQTRYSF